MNFTIVVQGPFDNHIFRTCNNIEHYLKYVNKVIVSCYDTCDTNNLEQYIANRGDKRVLLVKNQNPNFHCNPANMYVQAFSTLKGLEKVETEFAIKIRANEFYSQIDKVIASVEEFPNKWTAGNIFTIKIKNNSWKVSDHLFAARTSSLIYSMKQVMDWCHQCNQHLDKHRHLTVNEVVGHGQSEHVFFFGFLKERGIKLEETISPPVQFPRREVYRIMKEHLNIINVNDLKPIIWSCHHGDGPTKYFDNFEVGNCATSIEDLGEGI